MRANEFAQQVAVDQGWRGRNGRRAGGESGWTPTVPFGAGDLLVRDRKNYIACAGVSLAMGGITP